MFSLNQFFYGLVPIIFMYYQELCDNIFTKISSYQKLYDNFGMKRSS